MKRGVLQGPPSGVLGGLIFKEGAKGHAARGWFFAHRPRCARPVVPGRFLLGSGKERLRALERHPAGGERGAGCPAPRSHRPQNPLRCGQPRKGKTDCLPTAPGNLGRALLRHRRFRRVGNGVCRDPVEQEAALIADRARGDLDEPGAAAAHAPILQGPDGISEEFRSLDLVKKLVIVVLGNRLSGHRHLSKSVIDDWKMAKTAVP